MPLHNNNKKALLMILLVGEQSNFSWMATEKILNATNKLHNNDFVSATKYRLFKTVIPQLDLISFQLYCSYCKPYIGERK